MCGKCRSPPTSAGGLHKVSAHEREGHFRRGEQSQRARVEEILERGRVRREGWRGAKTLEQRKLQLKKHIRQQLGTTEEAEAEATWRPKQPKLPKWVTARAAQRDCDADEAQIDEGHG